MKTVDLSVPDISCGHCVEMVRSALSSVEGVVNVDVSLPTKSATVSVAESTSESTLLAAVRSAGYTPSRR